MTGSFGRLEAGRNGWGLRGRSGACLDLKNGGKYAFYFTLSLALVVFSYLMIKHIISLLYFKV